MSSEAPRCRCKGTTYSTYQEDSTIDRYEDMIIEAAEEEGDGRNLLSVSMFREFAINWFLCHHG